MSKYSPGRSYPVDFNQFFRPPEVLAVKCSSWNRTDKIGQRISIATLKSTANFCRPVLKEIPHNSALGQGLDSTSPVLSSGPDILNGSGSMTTPFLWKSLRKE